ncbi:lysophospholipid acyltransferase family protein [Larsenimonas suaedae]|uniref:Lysophospholipid acyltransferase family protein n=1 Tax=Larsenimonas suaedae TaxID=1851019 RepID=A0ABU1GYR9_9GAMM|nr:lysophospholipid acyltransferase family protein [Larsenimonas suaedae]MCM2973671.1 1-acyl-sn-glycerol-3-phosphate acyltransferase [Larsenimonas suaedae]MDR5897195.1 lysophospholipid acyltransferase family protein [Larsenimonas suaedae]
MSALRSVLFYIGYFAGIVFFGVLFGPIAAFLPLRRRFALLNSYNRFAVLWLKWTCGVRYKVEYQAPLPKGTFVMLSNHQSEWETLYLQLITSPVCTVLKKELLSLPIFGWALRLLNPIPLDRSNPSAALRAVISEGGERLKSGLSILIFPEGTRVEPGKRRRFNKSGALIASNAGVPVVPIAHNAGDCWPGKTFIKRPGTITVVIGAPIHANGRSAKEVIQEVERWSDEQLMRISRDYTPPK